MNKCVVSKIGVEKGYETEVRFGKYDNRGKFSPGISKSQFDLLVLTLDQMRIRKVITRDIVNSRTINRTTSVRKVSSSKNNSVLYETKEKINTIDLPELGFRLAKSKETRVSAGDYNAANGRNEYVQQRDRISYIVPGARIDMTHLPRNNTYQVEIEFTDVATVCGLIPAVQEVLNRWTVVRDYKKLAGSRFIGPCLRRLPLKRFVRRF